MADDTPAGTTPPGAEPPGGIADGSRTPGGDAGGARMNRRRFWVAALVAGAVALTGAGVAATAFIKSPAQVAADAKPPPQDVLIARVENRVLAETVVLRGTVAAGQSIQVAPVSAGGEGGAAPVITKVSVKSGDAVRSGKVLLEISGRPVFVLRGGLPVYRDLKPGATGDDVKQLQDALDALGHGRGGDEKGTFGPGTKNAVEEFYSSIGYDPKPAVDDDGAAVDGAKASVTGAERALVDARDALAATTDDAQKKTLKKARDRAAEDLETAREALAKAEAAAGPMVPAAEVVFVRAFPARVATVTARPGAQVSGTAMTLSSGRLMAQGYLQDHQKGLIRAGQKVRILAETTGQETTGRVVSVADTPSQQQDQQSGTQGSGSGGDGAGGDGAQGNGAVGYLFTVEPTRELPSGLAGQEVRLTIEAASTDGKALVVPVTAVSAGVDGKTVVTTVDGTGRQERIEVRTGTTGDGFVEVVPLTRGALKEGDEVVTGVNPGAAPGNSQGAP
ncbi:peptidoglycan-binding protein [Streptomyces sp. TLI_105]|uniref:peptidoglycan-binding protein n=1 Tax=Streptomyces sp. TLI_105 TaxID=1881019 RepID=UPI00089B5750|nr:peptidoglycan-binding protein [Streptomyces sp. TLI_105]SEC75694.1 Putative peptidoglycan binding domain-containing protein [Streptomyces sp. TLI_105]